MATEPNEELEVDDDPDTIAAAEAAAKEAKERAVENLLSKVDAKLSGNETLAKLIADPDVRALLDAKNAGKKVRVVEGDAEPPPS